jgi:hypothetical protein
MLELNSLADWAPPHDDGVALDRFHAHEAPRTVGRVKVVHHLNLSNATIYRGNCIK